MRCHRRASSEPPNAQSCHFGTASMKRRPSCSISLHRYMVANGASEPPDLREADATSWSARGIYRTCSRACARTQFRCSRRASVSRRIKTPSCPGTGGSTSSLPMVMRKSPVATYRPVLRAAWAPRFLPWRMIFRYQAPGLSLASEHADACLVARAVVDDDHLEFDAGRVLADRGDAVAERSPGVQAGDGDRDPVHGLVRAKGPALRQQRSVLTVLQAQHQNRSRASPSEMHSGRDGCWRATGPRLQCPSFIGIDA